jgi:hypothetical protein
MQSYLNLAASLFWFLSAMLWFAATCVWRRPEGKDSEGWEASVITDGAKDVLGTAERQVKWNRYAAIAATLAALLQGLALAVN